MTGSSDSTDGPRAAARHRARHLPKSLRLVRNHPRLFGSFALSAAIYALKAVALPGMGVSTGLLVAWDAGVLAYLTLALSTVSRFDLAVVRRRAPTQDEGGTAILVLTVASAVASLGAIVAELGSIPKDESRGPHLALAVLTILLSWIFIHVIFAFHYANEHYDAETRGLRFPEDDRPDYWDFVYFSFVIGMTFQVSDVQVTSKRLRRLVVAHGVISYVFSVAIVALVVNIAAGLIEGTGGG